MCPEMGGWSEAARIIWFLNVALQVCLLMLLVLRKDYRRFPAFCSYLAVNLLQFATFVTVFPRLGYASHAAWKIGWGSQGIVVVARAFAVGELCRHVLARYRGVWALGWRMLASIGVVVLAVAASFGRHDLQAGIVTLDLGSELAIAAVTAFLFAFAAYYDVPLAEPTRTMGIAFCLYSCSYVLNDLLLQHYLVKYRDVWNVAGMLAFLGSLLIWGWAFRRPAGAEAAKPVLLDAAVYRSLIPEVNRRLSGLNEQLSSFWKARSPRT